MSVLLDHAIKEKCNSMKINDPLIIVKNAIDCYLSHLIPDRYFVFQ